MASSTQVKLACALVLCLVVVAPHAVSALTCGIVVSKLGPCTGYLKGGAGPTPGCCAGVKALAALATTPPDRKTACGCLKSASGSIPGLSLPNAAALPKKCGVKVPYPISPNTDCSKVN